MQLRVGAKIVHSLHGVGTVESTEEKTILGKSTKFAVISFQDDKLKIMVNLDQKNSLIRPLMNGKEVESVMDHLKNHICGTIISKSTLRYNLNLQKIKSGDPTSMCEVIKELSALLEEKRITQKEMSMLEQIRKILASELSQVKNKTEEEMTEWIQTICSRQELVKA